MAKVLINVTLFVLQSEIQEILAQQPIEIQNAFADQNLYQELLAYILNRVPNRYITSDAGQTIIPQAEMLRETSIRRLQRDQISLEGVYAVWNKGVSTKKRSTNCDRL